MLILLLKRKICWKIIIIDVTSDIVDNLIIKKNILKSVRTVGKLCAKSKPEKSIFTEFWKLALLNFGIDSSESSFEASRQFYQAINYLKIILKYFLS